MLRQSPALLGATVDDTLACISSCPLDDSTLQPSPLCVLESCTSNLAKCLFSSSCRDGVMCEMKCTEPLAKTEEAVHFAGLMECMRVHCPGFPPKKSCAALHCSVEAASCAVHSKCRHTLECADKCVPDKYTAALTATDLPMPQEAVVKTSMLRQSPALLGATVDDTLACISSCPLDDSTLQPSPLCVLESCTSNLAKCLFSSSCRDGVMCEMKCTEPLAKTEEAVHFAGLMECMRVHCPGFPPKKSCAALHCSVEAASCAVHSKCRHTLECADKCVPDKYTAALTATDLPMPQEAVVKTSMLRQSPALLGATVDDTLACISSCPLDDSTLQPSPLCVLESCTSSLAKCFFSSSCRDGVMCEMKCTEPLAKTEEAVHFAGLMECMRVHCPGFPPKKSCAALHCSVEAASCAVHSKCRHTLECADKCVPDKYTAALTATDLPMPQEAVVKTSMLRQSPALLGATVDDTLACISSCPLDDSTLQPSPLCVLESCTSSLAKCLFSSSCRDGVMCEMKCTEPLAKTEEAVHFAGLMECMRVHCPGFPPKKSCAALHCSVEAASCAVHSKCRHTLECADKCVPDKYTAALTATDLPMPQEAVV